MGKVSFGLLLDCGIPLMTIKFDNYKTVLMETNSTPPRKFIEAEEIYFNFPPNFFQSIFTAAMIGFIKIGLRDRHHIGFLHIWVCFTLNVIFGETLSIPPAIDTHDTNSKYVQPA